jgi:hypothetical protein
MRSRQRETLLHFETQGHTASIFRAEFVVFRTSEVIIKWFKDVTLPCPHSVVIRRIRFI